MDFLIRHYEKLILVVCLLLLLFSLRYVSTSQENSQHETAGVRLETQNLVRCDNLVPEMSTESFETLDSILSSNLAQIDFVNSPNGRGKAGLLDGSLFVICKSKQCGYILPYSADVCPWCKTPQEAIGPEMGADHDLDQDGIPDVFEKATTFLHYRYRADGMEDYDNDGFLNLEEYRAGTALDDPESRPPLAYLLRVERAAQNELPLALKRIKPNGSANPNDWKATFTVDGEARTSDVKMGGAVPKMNGYTVTSFAQDQHSVVISNGTKSYTLAVGAAKLREEEYAVTLRYLANHMYGTPTKKTDVETLNKDAEPKEENPRDRRRNNMGGMNGMMGGMGAMGGMDQRGATSNFEPQLIFDVKVGDIFALKKNPQQGGVSEGMTGAMGGMGGRNSSLPAGYDDEEVQPIVEYYQMLEIQPGETAEAPVVIRVQPLMNAFGTPNGEPIVLTHIDQTDYRLWMRSTPDDKPNHDYLPPGMSRGGGMDNGMMGGGMGGRMR